MAIDHQKFAGILHEEDIAVDNIYCLASINTGEIPEDAFDVITDAIFGEVPVDASMHPFLCLPTDPEGACDEEIVRELISDKGITGFLVEMSFEAPVKFHDDGSFHTYGRGYTIHRLFLAQSIEEAVEMGVAWKTSTIDNMREAALKDVLDQNPIEGGR